MIRSPFAVMPTPCRFGTETSRVAVLVQTNSQRDFLENQLFFSVPFPFAGYDFLTKKKKKKGSSFQEMSR
jgi:hypothetical protein